MTVKNLGIIPGDPYPELHLEVDGLTAVLVPDQQKATLTDAGLVYLGPDFDDKVPLINFQAPNGAIVLRGFTRDSEVVQHFRDFLAHCNS